MFSENLKIMRKAKGYTQEELAIKLNVVRQTISKWEKGLSVPDADVLSKMAEVLDTKVSVLLGTTIAEETDRDAVAEQLGKISEQLAIKNRRSKKIWKTLGLVLLIVVLLNVILAVINILPANQPTTSTTTTESHAVDDTTEE